MTACSSKRTLILFYNWGQKLMCDLHYHPSKCQIISVTRKGNVVKFDYCMNDTVMFRTDSIKDLGIDISSSLVWNYHIRHYKWV